MAVYTVSLVARTPASSGAPTLTEVDRMVVDSVNYVDELNRPGSATLSVPVESMTQPVRDRLRQFDFYPCEVWIYRNSTMAWAGEIQTIGLDGKAAQLGCSGLAGYLQRMGATADLVFSNQDQASIVLNLILHWQSLQPYGHYGLDTNGGILATGVTKTISYLVKDGVNIGTKIQELAAAEDGFDYWVRPSDRKVLLNYPQRGTNLSSSVILDQRVITSANVAMSVAPGDLASVMTATGTGQKADGTQLSFTNTIASTAIRQLFGASWVNNAFDNVESAAELASRTRAFLLPRGIGMTQPGITMKPRVGADVGDFAPGDSVYYSYDAGLGYQSGLYRVSKVSVSVDRNGAETMGVEFI